jgi:FixJ family two-component response regulator
MLQPGSTSVPFGTKCPPRSRRGHTDFEPCAYVPDLQARFERLSPREREVLMHVLRGRLNKQIAADLGIDERSVKRHRTSHMAKIEVRSVAELARLAAEAGAQSPKGR